jgi:hypothetical protein
MNNETTRVEDFPMPNETAHEIVLTPAEPAGTLNAEQLFLW